MSTVNYTFCFFRWYHHVRLLLRVFIVCLFVLNSPLTLQSLRRRSSAPEMIRGCVGWNAAQFTPRSCASRTYFTSASELPNRSDWRRAASLSDPGIGGGPAFGLNDFLRSPATSQTRTVWSRDAETIRSSLGWNWAHMT